LPTTLPTTLPYCHCRTQRYEQADEHDDRMTPSHRRLLYQSHVMIRADVTAGVAAMKGVAKRFVSEAALRLIADRGGQE